jgi:hypothetical protein
MHVTFQKNVWSAWEASEHLYTAATEIRKPWNANIEGILVIHETLLRIGSEWLRTDMEVAEAVLEAARDMRRVSVCASMAEWQLLREKPVQDGLGPSGGDEPRVIKPLPVKRRAPFDVSGPSS